MFHRPPSSVRLMLLVPRPGSHTVSRTSQDRAVVSPAAEVGPPPTVGLGLGRTLGAAARRGRPPHVSASWNSDQSSASSIVGTPIARSNRPNRRRNPSRCRSGSLPRSPRPDRPVHRLHRQLHQVHRDRRLHRTLEQPPSRWAPQRDVVGSLAARQPHQYGIWSRQAAFQLAARLCTPVMKP